jgi:ribosome assembly protein 4
MQDEPTPYAFFVEETEIVSSVQEDILKALQRSAEDTLTIVYQPQSLFKVRPMTRCSSTLAGHTEAILSVAFSPDGSQLATASGDTTVRVWDMNTETPRFTLRGHTNWVQIVAWSPDGRLLASGSMDKSVRLWDAKTGLQLGDALKAHRDAITAIVWEPRLANKECNRFASSSRDGTVRVWDATLRRVQFVLTQHTAPVTCLRWGGEGMIYTGSRDKTIKAWDAKDVCILEYLGSIYG